MEMNAQTEAEALSRQKHGMRQLSLSNLIAEYAACGYHFDPSMACNCQARYMSGPRAGESYPARTLYPVQSDDGKSAFHFEARRDSNYACLQALRNSVFAVSRGRIVEV
jgi:hypothetical protein